MTAQIDVDDFLEHFGVPGMKWGKRNARRDESASSSKGASGSGSGVVEKPKMSRNKKIAIGIGIGAVVAVGAAVALSSMNKNMDLPISDLINRPSTPKGQEFVTSLSKKTASPTSPPTNGGGTSLTLGPRSSAKPSGETSTILGDRLKRAGLKPEDLNRGTNTPTYPRSSSGMNSAPSLDTLSKLMNGGPQVSFNSKTGKYETH